jgi:hypothetical protein
MGVGCDFSSFFRCPILWSDWRVNMLSLRWMGFFVMAKEASKTHRGSYQFAFDFLSSEAFLKL